jgi:hypothetical protein
MESKKKRAMIGIWMTLCQLLRELETETAQTNDAALKLYRQLLGSLPETVLVDPAFHDQAEVRIQGCTDLYSHRQQKHLSKQAAQNQRRSFRFNAGDRAQVYLGWYDGPELFQGQWLEALGFLINEIFTSNLQRALTPEQKFAMEHLIAELAKH